MMDCVFSDSLLVVFSLLCYAVCFLEQINSLSLFLSPVGGVTLKSLSFSENSCD